MVVLRGEKKKENGLPLNVFTSLPNMLYTQCIPIPPSSRFMLLGPRNMREAALLGKWLSVVRSFVLAWAAALHSKLASQ